MATFMEKVAAWYGQGTMQAELDHFLEEHAVGVTTDTDEQTHENMEVYLKFQKIIERGLSSFCKDEGIGEQEFYKRCEAEEQSDVSSRILTAILQGASYEAFLSLVVDWKEEQDDDDD
eukprot:TRINITY_DN3483_c0_g1_i1.p4 TRINITY_DN3483_c0_g1~~TRINITY_DN3483_c0_g1_i1.p4  ORF type:complete len:118 (+),score=44.20 TRINITY_DN3483_c0_g1_i1:151-504(+)